MNTINLTTLAIDTSCDETSCAIVQDTTVLSNVLPSQTEFHAKYGGVVPSIARLAHQERIDGVVNEALKKAKMTMKDIDLIAVTKGPGLAIALEVGIKKAKELAVEYKKPLMVVNHMEGHLLSAFAEKNIRRRTKDERPKAENRLLRFARNDDNELASSSTINNLSSTSFPTLGVLVSGKHTEIVLVKAIGDYEIIGETMDDACGEAFDKCGRMLGLGYPAGPVVAKFAKENRKDFRTEVVNKNKGVVVKIKESRGILELPVPMAKSNDLNFSYSGLKTAFWGLISELSGNVGTNHGLSLQDKKDLSQNQIKTLCVLFEEAAFAPIDIKLRKAVKKYNPKEIWLGGGVSANVRLRQIIRSIAKENKIIARFPYTNKLNTDNAAMIGLAANVRAVVSCQLSVHRKGGNMGDSSMQGLLQGDVGNSNRNSLLGIYTDNFDEIDRDPGWRLDEIQKLAI